MKHEYKNLRNIVKQNFFFNSINYSIVISPLKSNLTYDKIFFLNMQLGNYFRNIENYRIVIIFSTYNIYHVQFEDFNDLIVKQFLFVQEEQDRYITQSLKKQPR